MESESDEEGAGSTDSELDFSEMGELVKLGVLTQLPGTEAEAEEMAADGDSGPASALLGPTSPTAEEQAVGV